MIRWMAGRDKARKFTAKGNLIFCASSVQLIKPGGPESGTIQVPGWSSDVKKGSSFSLYFCASLGALM